MKTISPGQKPLVTSIISRQAELRRSIQIESSFKRKLLRLGRNARKLSSRKIERKLQNVNKLSLKNLVKTVLKLARVNQWVKCAQLLNLHYSGIRDCSLVSFITTENKTCFIELPLVIWREKLLKLVLTDENWICPKNFRSQISTNF